MVNDECVVVVFCGVLVLEPVQNYGSNTQKTGRVVG